MFKVTVKTDPRYTTGMKETTEDLVDENKLKELLGMDHLGPERWETLLKSGTVTKGMLTYSWVEEEVKKSMPKKSKTPKPEPKQPKGKPSKPKGKGKGK